MNDVREFDCTGCGRHIVVICEPPDICGACLTMPNWFDDPVLRAMLDPDYKVPTRH